jgi:hypothetical protein
VGRDDGLLDADGTAAPKICLTGRLIVHQGSVLKIQNTLVDLRKVPVPLHEILLFFVRS